jgi:FtsH-binding integral membrane protein
MWTFLYWLQQSRREVLTRRFLNVYGVVGIAFMAVLLVLVWFKLVPTSYHIPLFILAFVIWASRLVLRVIVARRERKEEAAGSSTPVP